LVSAGYAEIVSILQDRRSNLQRSRFRARDPRKAGAASERERLASERDAIAATSNVSPKWLSAPTRNFNTVV
jgi:hypothetical protein